MSCMWKINFSCMHAWSDMHHAFSYITHHACHVMNRSCFCSMEDVPERQPQEDDEACLTLFAGFVYSWVSLFIQDNRQKRKLKRAEKVG